MGHLKQPSGFGCGLYAIANMLRDESFITDQRFEDSKSGNHTGQINQWLLDHGKKLYLEPFYFNAMGSRLPKWICKMKPHGDDIFSIPILIDVQQAKTSKTHFIAAEITTNGELIVMDSLEDESYITTLNDFNRNHYRVFGVWYLRHYSEEGHLMRFKNKK